MSERDHDDRAGRTEAHRLDGFFDAAFAFAVSLLAIAGAEIPHSLHDLTRALYRIPAYACSFATLLVFWYRHVRWRERFRIHDSISVALSLMLVFFALIFVYPLDMVFSALFNGLYLGFAGLHIPQALELTSAHDLTTLYVVYGLAYASMAGCLSLLYAHSSRRLRGASRAHVIDARENLYAQCGSMSVALLSIVTALLLPASGAWSWAPGCMYSLLWAVYALTGRWSRRALARPA